MARGRGTACSIRSQRTATAASTGQINLSWADIAGETQYLIERSPDGTNSWAQVGTTLANTTTFNNTGLATGTKYYYRVKAVGTGGTSAASNIANADSVTSSNGTPYKSKQVVFSAVTSPDATSPRWVPPPAS